MPATLPVGAPDAAATLAGAHIAGLRGVRAPDGTVVDLDVERGRISAATPTGDRADAPAGLLLDARGWRVLPAACEPHAHLDKALTAARIPAGTGDDLVGAVARWRELAAGIDGADVALRARRAVGRYVARGTTTIRTHVDVPVVGDPLRMLDALLDLRDELAGAVTLQVCLLGGSHTSDAVYLEAAARGVDVLGGCPHLAPDPALEISRVLDLAERTGLPVDLHADEQTALPDAGLLDVEDLAQQVIARGLQQRVTASHAVRLGSLPPARLGPVVDLLARAGLGVVTLPITNLYLQGRDSTHLAPRGLTAVRALLDAGVPLAAGADNVRDPFNPAGTCDPFETTSLLMTAAHLTQREALDAVTAGARTVLGLEPAGPAVGERADLVLVPDVPLGDVLAGGEQARVVLTGGRVVADTRVASVLALDRSAVPTTTDLPDRPAAPAAHRPDQLVR
ncbi:amidohydrolase family protein [Cellulosimicrobium arenosum]|uniref:Amidohydrolase family protein n=2 Tax=Cellulosimicrobium arenosum TaxID=2708133 RepID=A0A927IYX3_9MICO|nr:amidohydrolase family protein [Cellulosimicrobium arenosum]MBD8078861.1 amidohydrolase family protein [Cellulosimicrobium arenosum]